MRTKQHPSQRSLRSPETRRTRFQPGPLVLAAAGALMAWLFSHAAQAMPVPPEPVPVERLSRNLEKHLKAHPRDRVAVFTLGRVHYFAFAARSRTVNALRGTENPAGVPLLYTSLSSPGRSVSARGAAVAMPDSERLRHVRLAVANLWAARAGRGFDPDTTRYDRGDVRMMSPGIYALCLACALEEGAPYAARAGAIPGVALGKSASAWRAEALRSYGAAFDSSAAGDARQTQQPIFGIETLVSHEAGHSYQRLLASRGGQPSADEAARLTRVEQHLARLEHLPFGPVTPIVLALDRPRALDDLIDAGKRVRFDLEGTGLVRATPWPKADAALLVWDPDNTGRIVSGRQLLGSVSWWMFWENGYQALGALDDDGDGWLSGVELEGLALWFDRDSNGASDPGEVVAMRATDIAALAVRATGRVGASWVSEAGLVLRDGRRLPTYDWVIPRRPPDADALARR